MQESDLKTLREALESYLKLLASGQYTGQDGVTAGEGAVSSTFEHLSQTLNLPNQAAHYWAGKLLRGLAEVEYFWAERWIDTPFDPPQPQLGESFSVPAALIVNRA
ncbi:hypothetical protein JST97_25085 [bacterium]|nr:hypothetical protein [bacterium]